MVVLLSSHPLSPAGVGFPLLGNLTLQDRLSLGLFPLDQVVFEAEDRKRGRSAVAAGRFQPTLLTMT